MTPTRPADADSLHISSSHSAARFNGRTNVRLAIAGIAVLGVFAILFNQTGMATENEPVADGKSAETNLLRHVVMFEFKEDAAEDAVKKVVDAFVALPSQIPEIADFEYGENNSPEKLNEGLTHCFLVSFKSEADRAAYLPHPAHQAFVKVLKPVLKKVVVIDYWAK